MKNGNAHGGYVNNGSAGDRSSGYVHNGHVRASKAAAYVSKGPSMPSISKRDGMNLTPTAGIGSARGVTK